MELIGNIEKSQIQLDSVGTAYFMRASDASSRKIMGALIEELTISNRCGLGVYKNRVYVLDPEIRTGLYMYPVSYVEEVRRVKLEERREMEASEFREHVEMAKSIVRAFNVTNFKYMQNPAVEHVRACIEEIIKVRELGNPVLDECRPTQSRLLKARDNCREWQQKLALLDGGQASYRGDYKRARTEAAGMGMRAEVEVPTVEQMKSLINMNMGGVARLTVPVLRAFLKNQLKVGDSGNKGELVERVERNMQGR